jgi:lysophospholipase L1-like esterase
MRALALAALLVALPSNLAAQPVTFQPGERVVLVGNTLCERMQLFNHFETLLMARYGDLNLTVRNLCWSADTPALQPRPLNFGDAPTHLYRQKADVILAFFGQSESFEGEAGVAQFQTDLATWVRANLAATYNGKTPPRIVLISPAAHEKLARLPRIDVAARNRELARYAEAMRKVAAELKVGFVDLHTPTVSLTGGTGESRAGPAALTINGIHLTEHGDRVVGRLLVDALAAGAAREASAAEVKRLDELRELIHEKNQQFFYRFRPVNAEYVVGRRVEPFGSQNFPGEMKQLDDMVSERDKRIHALAAKLKGFTYPALTGGTDHLRQGYGGPRKPPAKAEVPPPQSEGVFK